ncbi:ImmA/IrrE family metallo-endopeptidase [Campylobacter sp. faydin G-140]|uniref:ImmA/IrrE family metallo-endopeptidase n=1 Tax=Campylobacter anatolicus TaxID=2829105 RepID=UPI001B9774CA|nr:ImmA/IrrE family metallo-endopeptidase [Campylobacter anatolicus]MBR8466492.1 ImmA/IrrE family metallo-endopeptidase [Campylobacter anatolicus]
MARQPNFTQDNQVSEFAEWADEYIAENEVNLEQNLSYNNESIKVRDMFEHIANNTDVEAKRQFVSKFENSSRNNTFKGDIYENSKPYYGDIKRNYNQRGGFKYKLPEPDPKFNDWFDLFAEQNQLGRNDIFSVKGFKEKEFRQITFGQIEFYVKNRAKPETREKFKASVEEGIAQGKLISYLSNASSGFKIKEREEIKERAKQEWVDSKKNEWKNIRDEANNIAKSFDEIEAQLKNSATAEKALATYYSYIKQFGYLYNYSARNVLLIKGQLENRGISSGHVVKSEKDWAELGIDVKGLALNVIIPTEKTVYEKEKITDENGEEIYIFKLDENGKKIPLLDENGKPKTETGFSLSGKVYDVAQTDAYQKGYKKMADFMEIEGMKINQDFFNSVKDLISNTYDIDIFARPLEKTHSGYATINTTTNRKEIHIDTLNTTTEQRLAILLHETGHQLLHFKKGETIKDPSVKSRREAEAESFAYVLGKQFGIKIPSTEYILGYMQNMPEASLQDVFNNVHRAVKDINTKININEMVQKEIERQLQETVNSTKIDLAEVVNQDTEIKQTPKKQSMFSDVLAEIDNEDYSEFKSLETEFKNIQEPQHKQARQEAEVEKQQHTTKQRPKQ